MSEMHDTQLKTFRLLLTLALHCGHTAVAATESNRLIDHVDANHDGMISSAEQHEAPSALRRLDVDQDGRLSQPEWGLVRETPPTSTREPSSITIGTGRGGWLRQHCIPARVCSARLRRGLAQGPLSRRPAVCEVYG